MSILITGGCGFIGLNFIKNFFSYSSEQIINIDKLTYAANLTESSKLEKTNDYIFFKGDINDSDLINNVLAKYKPRAIINFAAETHVDRSIDNAGIFINTNVNGTYNLLECTKKYLTKFSNDFRFIHISTDEVFGSLNFKDKPFNERSKYDPSSPYSASKASSDHLVRSWARTYDLPAIITNCSNNYGPYQNVEKLIPRIISNSLNNLPLPVYGSGKNIRDWLYVEDHCNAIMTVLNYGEVNNTYCIGGNEEITNIDLVKMICNILDELVPKETSYSSLIKFVKDRPGHDLRYAIDFSKIHTQLSWMPKVTLQEGLRKTVLWYLDFYNLR